MATRLTCLLCAVVGLALGALTVIIVLPLPDTEQPAGAHAAVAFIGRRDSAAAPRHPPLVQRADSEEGKSTGIVQQEGRGLPVAARRLKFLDSAIQRASTTDPPPPEKDKTGVFVVTISLSGIVFAFLLYACWLLGNIP
mmetsp:Transcript_26357/g.55977  ORF Transcript_26357/g.55977 Transcript_26357/m.55977 type:complete len:139 (-) Transcript_26357:20-436(-)